MYGKHSVYPNQTPSSAASDQDLYYLQRHLPFTPKYGERHVRANNVDPESLIKFDNVCHSFCNIRHINKYIFLFQIIGQALLKHTYIILTL